MIIIWGHTNKTTLRHDTTVVLGRNPKCPMRNCKGQVRLYDMQRYCHMYWIPCTPEGPKKEVVKCMQCQAMFDLASYQRFQQQQRSGIGAGPSPLADQMKKLIEKGQFELAELICREILKRDPMNINVMTYLGVALNNMGKATESDRVTSQIVFHWETHCRSNWISQGFPKELSAFPRLILNQGLANYNVEAKQFFEPEMADAKRQAIFKILAIPKNHKNIAYPPPKRLFKLLQNTPAAPGQAKSGVENNNNEGFVLVEVLPSLLLKTVATYPAATTASTTDILGGVTEETISSPDIRKVAADVVAFLTSPNPEYKDSEDLFSTANNPTTTSQISLSPDLELLDDGHAGFKFLAAAESDPLQRGAKLKEAVSISNWRAIKEFFVTLSQQLPTPSDLDEQRSFWMGVVAGGIEQQWSREAAMDIFAVMSPGLDAWLQAEPNNMDCRLIRLKTQAAWAWAARSAALARNVSQQQFAVFHKRLREAAEELKQAKGMGCNDPILYECAVPILKGYKSLGPICFTMEQCMNDILQSSNPLSYLFHTSALQYHCQKWHGSHKKMFEFTKEVTSRLSDGHPLWVLVPMSHYERNLIQPIEGYWQRQQVKKDILLSYEKAFSESSSTSAQDLLMPHQRKLEGTSRNFFAYCLIMIGEYDKARDQFRVTGKRPTSRAPWHTLGRYRYFAGLLGFENEGRVGDTAEDEIPVAQASVVTEMANAMQDSSTIASSSGSNVTAATTPMPTAEVEMITEDDERASFATEAPTTMTMAEARPVNGIV